MGKVIMCDPEENTTAQTKVVVDNGLNPKWNEEFFFPMCCPGLSTLRFVVYDRDTGDLIGQYSIHLNCVRQGLRMVPLLAKNGMLLRTAYLFCDVSIDAVKQSETKLFHKKSGRCC